MGTDFICGMKCERVDSMHSWGSSCVKQVWCVLMRVLAASVLEGLGQPWVSNVGLVERRLCWPGSDSWWQELNFHTSTRTGSRCRCAGVAERVDSRCRHDGREHGFHCR